MIKVFNVHGVNGVRMMQHGAGRRAKIINITQAQINIITSKETLQQHATKSLAGRCAIYNEQWKEQGCNLTTKDLKAFYNGAGITFQRYTTILGPPKVTQTTMEAQKKSIELCQKSLMYWRNRGFDVFQLDEAVFNKNDCDSYAWAPKGDPLVWDWKG